MHKGLSQYNLDFIRRAGKEIISCLKPEELPFFDIAWKATESLLKDSEHLEHSDRIRLQMEQLYGQAFSAPWSKDADLLTCPLIMILCASLQDASTKGLCEQEEIGQLVAQYSLRYPLPDQFLHMVQTFVTGICGGVAQIDEKTKKLLEQATLSIPHKTCYYVFHYGKDHFYQNELPHEVHNLRETTLFWINPTENDFLSRGKHRESYQRLKRKELIMLRFLCDEKNAGKTISLWDLWSEVWGSHRSKNIDRIINSINVAENAINLFAETRFISDKSKHDNAKIRRIRGENKLEIATETPKECCIVKKFTLPE